MPAMREFVILFLIILMSFRLAFSSENEDVVSFPSEIDSLINNSQIDSLVSDTLLTETMEYDSLFYSADSIFYSLEKEKIDLIGNASIKYQSSDIKADTITINIAKDQAFTKGNSYLKDGDQTALGNEIYYDLKSQWGMIENGASKFDKGYYYGEEIRKIDTKTFDVDKGIFTTCDALHPHFYIRTNKLRLYQNDKIVGKPIIFYVNHFPVFAFPFGTFTVKRGRHTGILVPSPGYNKTYGKHIENIAFYYAYKDYADAIFSFDYFEKTGWELTFFTQYLKRYLYDGDFTVKLHKRTSSPEVSTYDWLMKAQHHHDFGNRTTFDANLEFVSSKQIWEGSSNIDERLSEWIKSSLAYKKPFLGNFLYMNASYKDDFLDETKDLTLPKISYSLPSKPIYELFLKDENFDEDAWWTDFSYSYNFKAAHIGDINDPNAGFKDVIYKVKKDSSGSYINQHNAGVKHSGGLRYSHKLKGWLDVSQSVSANEAWFDRDKNEKKLVRGFDYSTNSGIGFSLYGLRKFPGFYVSAVRHILSPKVGFTYKPDFTENERFYNFGGIGLSSSSKQRKVSFSLNNTWQLKLIKTESLKERKINDFFKFNSGISYDFENEGKGFGNISHSIYFNPDNLDLKYAALSFRPYGTISQETYGLRFKVWDYKSWDFAVSNWTFNTTTKLTFSGDANYIDYFPEPENRFISSQFFQDDSLAVEEEQTATTLEELEQLSIDKKNWSISFTNTFKTTKALYKNKDFTSSLRTNLSLKLTKNWSLAYDNYIDIKKKEMISHNITITRELHCWKIVFKYTKQTDYWNYSFQLFNIKLPQDLKFRTSDHKK